VNTASELTLKATILDYEESLFLLSQSQLETQKLRNQMKWLLGHSPDDRVEFERVTSAAIQSTQSESEALSVKRQLNRANREALSHQINQINASDGVSAAIGTFYEHNLFSSQRVGLELNIMMPIIKSTMTYAKETALKEKQALLDSQLIQTERQETQERQQLRAEIEVLESHLTLTDRRRELANQKLKIDQGGHQNGLTSLMALFTTEIEYRQALLHYRTIQYEYLERIYIYNLSVSKPDANWVQLDKS
jgi:outer membrane protein TolC